MSIQLTIPGGGGCCPCENQNGCDCSSIPCARECRSKAGVALLCGFEELTDPSVPPKVYRRRRVNGTLNRSYFTGLANCECTGGFGLSWSNGECTASASIVPVSETETTVNYQVLSVSCVCGDHNLAAAVNGPNGLTSGQTFSAGKGTPVFTSLWVYNVVWTQVDVGCILPGGRFVEDSWNLDQVYDEDTCVISETDYSERTTIAGSVSTGDIPCDSPHGCYDPSQVDEAVTKTTRSTQGKGCVTNIELGGGKVNAEGTVNEELSQEDTEADALTRALAGLDWSYGSCDDLTAFRTVRGAGGLSFGFRNAEVRLVVGSSGQPLTIGHVYKITVRFRRRIVGSSGPFLPFEIQELTVIADETVETTPWIEIPNEPGYETKASGCTVEDVTP